MAVKSRLIELRVKGKRLSLKFMIFAKSDRPSDRSFDLRSKSYNAMIHYYLKLIVSVVSML